MNHWHSRLETTGVPTPKTEFIELRDWEEATRVDDSVPMPNIDTVKEAIDSVGGPPAFLRTDQAGDKHRMGRSSYVGDLDDAELFSNVSNVLEYNQMAGLKQLPYTHLVVREWLDLKHTFKAFDQTPIASEIRAVIDEGDVVDYQCRWDEEDIAPREMHNRGRGLPTGWRDQLRATHDHAMGSFDKRGLPLAEIVSNEFDSGHWTVDFAEDVSGKWWAIDMSVRRESKHPPGHQRAEKVEQ